MTVTPSSTNICSIIGIDASGYTYTPTPTATPTVTPTQYDENTLKRRPFYSKEIVRDCPLTGSIEYTNIIGEIICPGSFKFQDCYNGDYYYTINFDLPDGLVLEPQAVYGVSINGENKCVAYLENTDNSPTNILTYRNGPWGLIYDDGACAYCQLAATPTPTPSITPTMTQTPTTTPTTTITPTTTPTSTVGSTPPVTPTQTKTPTPTMTYTPTQTPTQTPPGLNIQCDLQTADITFLIGSTNAAQTTVYVSNDGNRLYVLMYTLGTIKQASISVGNDLTSTISYVNQSPVIPGAANNFKGITFSSDGLKVFAFSQSALGSPATILEFSLSTAWDITSMSTTPTSTLSYPSPIYVARMFTFNSTGTRIYSTYSYPSGTNYSVYWDLSSPYTISTAGTPVTSNITSTFGVGTPSGTLYLENGINQLYIPIAFSITSVYQNGTTNSEWLYNTLSCLWYQPSSSNYSYIYDTQRVGSGVPYTWLLKQSQTGLV
jgi:hypothetical protein